MEQTISVSVATPSASTSDSDVSVAVLAATPLKDALDIQSDSDEPPSGTTSMNSPPISPIPNATKDSHLSSPQPTLALPKTHADMSSEATSDYYSGGSGGSGGGSDNGQDDDSVDTATAHDHQQISALSPPSSSDTQAMDDNTTPQTGFTPESNSDATDSLLEQMGLHNMSTTELVMLLQGTYEIIQEKDRDINMAAMMGQNLVQSNSVLAENNNALAENNTALQAKYQHLLTQLRHQRMHRPRHLTPPRKIALGATLGVGGGYDEAMDGDENWVDFEPSQSSSSLLQPPSSQSPSYRRSTGQSGLNQSRSRQDIEKLATLEEQNSQLQTKVDSITKELKQGRRQAFKRHRKSEKELKAVREELDQSAVKVVDLEAQNGRLIEASRQIRLRRIMLKSQLPAPGSIPGSTMAAIAMEMEGDEFTIQEMLAEDNRIFEELRDRLQSLERKNTNLQHQKVESDKRAQQLVLDLSKTQSEREELLANLAQMVHLQDAYDQQKEYVMELENMKEELQNTIGTMGSRLSQMNSPLMSPSGPLSPVQSVWRRDDADFKALKTILHGTSSPRSPGLIGSSPRSPGLKSVPRSPALNSVPRSPALNSVPRSPALNSVPRSPKGGPRSPKGGPRSPGLASPGVKAQRRPRMTLLAELENEWFRNVSFFGSRVPEQPQQQQPQQQPIHIAGLKSPKSPKALKDHRHDSESETFSDDAGGRVKGWRRTIRSMDEESVCESSSCVRKKRRHRFKYDGSDTDGARIDEIQGEDSDVERYQLLPRGRNPQGCVSSCGDETDDMSDCDPHHVHYPRPSTPGCCCLYSDYSDYSSYDEDDGDESVAGWAHFIDHDASIFGYDVKRDGRYAGRRQYGLFQTMFLLLRYFWRWCRFICILSTALGIALYRGPDALLTDGQ